MTGWKRGGWLQLNMKALGAVVASEQKKGLASIGGGGGGGRQSGLPQEGLSPFKERGLTPRHHCAVRKDASEASSIINL